MLAVKMRLHSLTSRFLLTLLLSTTLPFFAIGWFALGEMRKGLEVQVAEKYLPRWADDAAWRVSDRLVEIRQVCDQLLAPASKVLSAEGIKDFEDQIAATSRFLNNVDLILITDADGNIVHRKEGHNLPEQTRDSRTALIPETVADEQWFKKLKRGDDSLVWTPWGLSKYMHRETEHESRDPSDYHVGLAMGISGARGALFVLIRWQEVQAVLDETQSWLQEQASFPSAQVFLCNGGGTVLAHSDRQKYGTPLTPQEFLGELLLVEGVGGSRFLDEDERPRRAGYARVLIEGGPTWWLGLHVEERELFAASFRLAEALVLAIGIAMVILTAWSLVASRAILRPVRSLVSATEAVAKGDLSVRVPARGKHELADLGRAFNSMAEDLSVSQEQLRRAERQAAWAEMARQVAHEIKNPLTPMRMSAQLLLKARREGGERVDELTDRLARTVLAQTEALDRIASDFRHFAGSPTRELGVHAADDLLVGVEEGFGAMAEGSGVKLTVCPGAGGTMVKVDEHEFRRVFLNLLHNALASCGEKGEVELKSSTEGDIVLFRVTDNGPGIPENLRDKLFEPYFTTKSSGTGLGLAICRRIVEAHDGVIELESSKPGRTVFRLRLPIAAPAP